LITESACCSPWQLVVDPKMIKRSADFFILSVPFFFIPFFLLLSS